MASTEYSPATTVAVPKATRAVGNIRFNLLTEEDVIQHILSESRAGRGGWVVTPNIDICRQASRDPATLALVHGATLVVPDGMPLIWAAKIKGAPLAERVTGSSLIFTLTEAAAQTGLSIYLLGGGPGVPEAAGDNLASRYPGLKVAGTDASRIDFGKSAIEIAAVRERVDAAAPDIIYVGLGFPKQERLISELAPMLPAAWFIACGAAIPFAAGTVPRAPVWMQRSGLEWAHRLLKEPRRLFRRYLVHDLPFAARLMITTVVERSQNGMTSELSKLPSAGTRSRGTDMTWNRTPRPGTLLASGLILGLTSISACTTTSPLASGVNGAVQGTARAAPRQAAPEAAILRPVDGGPDYYARFSPSLPVSPSFFPIGVWFDSVTQESDTRTDKGAGVNVYVQMTDNSNMELVRQASMYAIDSNYTRSYGSETAGWLVADEADMWGGPGSTKWSGNYAGQGTVCVPSTAFCGYTILNTMLASLPRDHRLRYANFGKGVTFWDSHAGAAKFVNGFADVVSDDNYWLTDDDICDPSQGGQYFPKKDLVPATATTPAHLPPQLCHLPSNYYITVGAVRSLESPEGSRPVWGFVELAHPSDNNGWPTATPSQIAAAVWASLIGGARGIIYFNHSFGGSCITDSALRDPCYAKVYTAVQHVDSEIRSLAPMLNAPFADHVAAASNGVIFTVKWYQGHFYLIAGSRQPGPQVARFSMPCVGSAKVAVLFENRTLNLKNGVFSDRFANGDTDHIYRIDGGLNCGA